MTEDPRRDKKLGISRDAWSFAIRWGIAFGGILLVLVPIFYEFRPTPDWGWLISRRLWFSLFKLALGVVLLAWLADRFGETASRREDGAAPGGG